MLLTGGPVPESKMITPPISVSFLDLHLAISNEEAFREHKNDTAIERGLSLKTNLLFIRPEKGVGYLRVFCWCKN